MKLNHERLVLSGILLLGLPLASMSGAYAAKPINLSHQQVSILQSFVASSTSKDAVKIEEVNRSLDFNQTLHVRVKETYMGYSVLGGEAIVHIPHGANTEKSIRSVVSSAQNNNGSMDGILFDHLQADLARAPENLFAAAQSKKALQSAINAYQKSLGAKPDMRDSRSQLMVYVDKNNKAHWVFKVSFFAEPVAPGQDPAIPTYIMDATTLQVYRHWNNLQTVEREATFAGGLGGNEKMGQVIYDGLSSHLPKLNVMRDADTSRCFIQNSDVTVKRYVDRYKAKQMKFACDAIDTEHNVYWDGDHDAVNGGYSPSNDALFFGAVIKDMYQKWYHLPVLVNDDGSPMMLNMVVHYPHYDNAYWDGQQMTFGDGQTMFYPLTSLGVAAHEISHGFTTQHSNLDYEFQSGGMNEAFSDMAAQAAEFYAYGKNSWQIGPEIFKADRALRYMDQPSKDCAFKRRPYSQCSIDDASQYTDDLDPHYSSGVYNHFFYLLATAKDWDVKKAFDVMVQANGHYWISSTGYKDGACGVIKAAQDYKYDVDAVKQAFAGVAIDTSSC